jgi:hypothetical protein
VFSKGNTGAQIEKQLSGNGDQVSAVSYQRQKHSSAMKDQ